MKFVAHDHHNNNSYAASNFTHANGGSRIAEGKAVHLTDSGIAFFMLDKKLGNYNSYDDKMALIAALDEQLKVQIGQGLTAVTCANSDCAPSWRFPKLFAAVKAIDPAIRTIEIGINRDQSAADMQIRDTSGDRYKRAMQAAVDVQPGDMAQPCEGWDRYQETLELLRDAAAVRAEATLQRPLIGFRRTTASLKQEYRAAGLEIPEL